MLVQPLRSLAGRPLIWRKVLAAWVFAFIFAVPQLFIFVQTDEGRWTKLNTCAESPIATRQSTPRCSEQAEQVLFHPSKTCRKVHSRHVQSKQKERWTRVNRP